MAINDGKTNNGLHNVPKKSMSLASMGSLSSGRMSLTLGSLSNRHHLGE